MELPNLRALVAVHDAGSLREAAAQLGISRAALARRLDRLAAATGAQLLIAEARGVRTTPAGVLLVDRGRALLGEADALARALRERADDDEVVRVGLPVGLPPEVVGMAAAAVWGLLGALPVELYVAADPVADLYLGLDLVAVFGSEPPAGPWVTMVVRHLEERLLASPAWLAAHGAPRLEDLAGARLLTWRPPGEDARIWPAASGPVAVRPALVANDIHLLHALAAQGHGIARVPDGRIPAGLAPTLETVLEGEFHRKFTLRVLLHEAHRERPVIRRLLALFRTFTDAL
jgi:DNA-binding transcriptional LysR family regulator